MDSRVEVKAQYVRDRCKQAGEEISCFYETKPMDYAVLRNRNGDIGSVGPEDQLYEPFRYIPKWSKYMENWAREEGFSEEQIANQNLIRNVSLDELVDFFTRNDS